MTRRCRICGRELVRALSAASGRVLYLEESHDGHLLIERTPGGAHDAVAYRDEGEVGTHVQHDIKCTHPVRFARRNWKTRRRAR